MKHVHVYRKRLCFQRICTVINHISDTIVSGFSPSQQDCNFTWGDGLSASVIQRAMQNGLSQTGVPFKSVSLMNKRRTKYAPDPLYRY